ncbi:piggyBac transposable element-derived protein 4-like [Cotesia glomerata]|uniref:piggyBac transposable element-derived protein 4-like n=1 Tax=Cotesia glomerata TaxID=32391 RepID=UPI001D01349D|nr:piggyBac transposable element-derived protein 4-like [Cotesia glomerata]
MENQNVDYDSDSSGYSFSDEDEDYKNREFFEIATEQTNLYAQQMNDDGHSDKDWSPVTIEEMEAFLGVIIYMGIVKLPQIEMYFGTDFVECPMIKKAMSYKRFKAINRYLHFNDNKKMPPLKSPDYDRLYKIRPLLNILDKFKYFYRPDRDLSVDEAMIAYKGNFSAKQYMKDKPTSWGLKMWVIAESKTGYVLDAKPYLGKKEEKNKECENNIYACGTIRTNRKEWPKELKNPKDLKLERGDIRQMQCNRITATIWQDNRAVSILSTNCDPTDTVVVKKYSKKDKKYIDFPCPKSVANYNEYMGGVDLADQKRKRKADGSSDKDRDESV